MTLIECPVELKRISSVTLWRDEKPIQFRTEVNLLRSGMFAGVISRETTTANPNSAPDGIKAWGPSVNRAHRAARFGWVDPSSVLQQTAHTTNPEPLLYLPAFLTTRRISSCSKQLDHKNVLQHIQLMQLLSYATLLSLRLA